MRNYRTSEIKRYISGIIGIMMLVFILFSAIYITSEAAHECPGEDCPICTCIQFCNNTLHQIGFSISGRELPVFLCCTVLFLAVLFEVILPHKSLISSKIRMND